MTKIFYTIGWNSEKNIGSYYNDFMKLLPDNAWMCAIDGDAMFTTVDFGKQLELIIENYPECGCFTAMTNRIGCLWQQQPGVLWDENNIDKHRKIGHSVQASNYLTIQDVSHVPTEEVLGGVLILLSKKIWREIGGFKKTGLLGVDNDLHWKCMEHHKKVYLMKGVYLYHWYRWDDQW